MVEEGGNWGNKRCCADVTRFEEVLVGVRKGNNDYVTVARARPTDLGELVPQSVACLVFHATLER